MYSNTSSLVLFFDLYLLIMKLSINIISLAQLCHNPRHSIQCTAGCAIHPSTLSYFPMPRSPITLWQSMCTVIPPTFDALHYISTKENQLKVVQLSIFEATYHDNVTSLTLDMYSLIIDTGARPFLHVWQILLLPFALYRCWNQRKHIKISSAQNWGHNFLLLWWKWYSATPISKRCLNVTVHYNTITQLSLLYTAPGIIEFQWFSANLRYEPTHNTGTNPQTNMTLNQQKR